MSIPSFPIHTVSTKANGAVTALRCVGYDGAQVAAGATPTRGISRHDAADTEQLPLDVLGEIPVEAGGAISVGDDVEANADGKVVAQSSGLVVGRATLAAAADGDIIRIERIIT